MMIGRMPRNLLPSSSSDVRDNDHSPIRPTPNLGAGACGNNRFGATVAGLAAECRHDYLSQPSAASPTMSDATPTTAATTATHRASLFRRSDALRRVISE